MSEINEKRTVEVDEKYLLVITYDEKYNPWWQIIDREGNVLEIGRSRKLARLRLAVLKKREEGEQDHQ